MQIFIKIERVIKAGESAVVTSQKGYEYRLQGNISDLSPGTLLDVQTTDTSVNGIIQVSGWKVSTLGEGELDEDEKG